MWEGGNRDSTCSTQTCKCAVFSSPPRLTHSLRVQQQDSPSSPDEHFHFSRSISFGTEKSTSVKKKISKMVRRSLRLERRGIGSTMSPSGSVPSKATRYAVVYRNLIPRFSCAHVEIPGTRQYDPLATLNCEAASC